MGSISGGFPPLQYPAARRDESIVEDYHGTLVADPYRWMEDANAEETKDFVARQVEFTAAVMEKCKDQREKILEEVKKMVDYPRFEKPVKRGGKYFYFHNSGLQAHNVILVQHDPEGEPEVLVDPNAESEDGSIGIQGFIPSEDGQLVACGVSEGGSDWVTIRVISVHDKRIVDDKVRRGVKFFMISWSQDGKGFFYSRFCPPKDRDGEEQKETSTNTNQELYYHFIGTDQSEDLLCWRDPEHPNYMCTASVTEDGRYLLLKITVGSKSSNKLYYCDLSLLPGGLSNWKTTVDGSGSNGMLPFIKVIDNFEAEYVVVANDGPVFTILTNKQAPRHRLIRVDIREPDGPCTEVIPEHEKDVLKSVVAVGGDSLVAWYISDVKHVLQVRDLRTGTLLRRLPLDVGAVKDVSGCRRDPEFFVWFASFLTPGIIYRCHVSSSSSDPAAEMLVFREVSVQGLDPMDFEVKQVFVPNGTVQLPMFVVSRKGIALDGNNPTLLYGYGGFNISLSPTFRAPWIMLVKNLGFVCCLANIRGGGEYGKDWYEAGSLGNKQNTLDDFAACAEFLVAAGYTVPSRLCIEGSSNGGLLVAACLTQRPELYGCVIAHGGVMDMLRFHKFTIGCLWTGDYGCSEKEEDFQWLIKYSPLHNVRRPWEGPGAALQRQYPAVMVLTSDHDERVAPLHSLKLVATMQHELCISQGSALGEGRQTNPIICRIDCSLGHGIGRPILQQLVEVADKYAFAAMSLGASWIN